MSGNSADELRYLEVATSLFRRLKKSQLKPRHIRPELLEKWIKSIEFGLLKSKKRLVSTIEKRNRKYDFWRNGFKRFVGEYEDFLNANPPLHEYESLYEHYRNELAEEGKRRQFSNDPDWFISMKKYGYESAINWAILEAAGKFDVKKGGQFNVVAFWEIRNAVQKIQRGRKLESKKMGVVRDLTSKMSCPDAESSILKSQYIDAISQALDDISSRDRGLLTAKYILGISASEIAEKLELSKTTVYNRLDRACKNLEMQLLENLHISDDYRHKIKEEVVELILY